MKVKLSLKIIDNKKNINTSAVEYVERKILNPHQTSLDQLLTP